MARKKPKEKDEITEPTILRSIRLANGDVYGPGEEDAFLEALKKQADDSVESEVDVHDADEEIKRLTKLGFLANFVELENDDEEDDITHDQKSDRAIVKEARSDNKRKRIATEVDEDDVPTRERARNAARLEEEAGTSEAKPPKRKNAKAAGDEKVSGTE